MASRGRLTSTDNHVVSGAAATASNVSHGSMRASSTIIITVMITLCSGVNTRVSTTVCTHQLSPVMRARRSPTELREWNNSDRRWVRSKTSAARSYTIAWPTLTHSVVSTTSRVLPAAKMPSSATTTQTSRPLSWLPSTSSTSTLRGHGYANPRPALAKVTRRMTSQPFQKRPA